MAREKKKRASKRIRPEDVLEGRVKVDALELFRLIHRVNPTNRPLSRQEAQRRYEEKHKLQSFLVLNFGEDHVVVSRAEKEGVVQFDHPSGIFDACHAPLAALEPEARSLIQRRLDMAGDGEDDVLRLPDPGGGADEGSDDPLVAARRAVAEFDYANAERLLTKAFDAGRGDVPLVVELLALKVETLGLDEEALALRPRLAAAALDDVGVRSLLALAAARHGHGELAEKLASGLGNRGTATSQVRRAAAYAALAARAVEAADEAAARRWLAELVDCDPFHEGIATVRAGLERLARAGMRAAETELDELYREGGCLEAAAAARTLADRWPDSELARRILREAGELRRQTAVAEHLEIADRALAEEDFDTAVRHYEAVLAEDAEVPDVPRRLEQARRGARERAEASAVGAVEQRFSGAETRRALLAYLELPHPLRDRLRSRLEDQDARCAVADLDAVDAAHPRLRTGQSRLKAAAAVDAVLALSKAQRLFAEDRAEEAWAALGAHREVLAAVQRTASLHQEIVGRLIEERARKNLELIRQVEASFKDETRLPDPEKNLALLDQIDLDYLTPEYKLWVETAQAVMRRSAELHTLTESYTSNLKAGQLFAARELSRQYREMATRFMPAESLERRTFPGQFLDDEIKRVWQVKHESWRLGKALGPYPGILQPRPRGGWRSESRGLDDEGRRLAVAQAFVDWLFVTIVDVDGGKVLERLSMNTPKPLGAPLTVCWDGDALRIGGGEGVVVVLEPEGWKIAEWAWLPQQLGKAEIERTLVLPRSPYVWVFSRSRRASISKVQVLERDAWRVMRTQTGVLAAAVLSGLRPAENEDASPRPRILVSGRKGTFLCAARGHRDPDQPLVDRWALAAAADGTGIVALLMSPSGDLATTEGPEAEGEGVGLGLARFQPGPGGWHLAREVRLASASSSRPVMVAADGVVFALIDTVDGEAWLIAAEGETLKLLYSLRVPHASALAGDRYGRHAVLLLDGEGGPEVARLGRDAPRLRWKWRPLAQRRLPVVELHGSCMSQFEKGRKALKAYDALPPSRRREHMLGMARASTAPSGGIGGESTVGNLEEVILLTYVLYDRDRNLVKDVLAELHGRHPENLDVAFLLAEWQCRLASVTEKAADWKQALEMVLGIDPDWMTVFRRHFHHVQGVACLFAGRIDEARQVLEAGLAHHDGGCDLEPLLELAKPMRMPPKASEWSARHPLTRQLVGALRVATAAIKRDDDRAAVATLEHPAVWLAAETETLTRLAIAHIALVDDPADAGFEARLALSYLLEVIKVEGPRRVPPADVTAAAQNLENAGDTVRQWLGIVAAAEAKVREKGSSAP
jgi:hypothetical protein